MVCCVVLIELPFGRSKVFTFEPMVCFDDVEEVDPSASLDVYHLDSIKWCKDDLSSASSTSSTCLPMTTFF